jgi:hypothetical protein
MAVMELDRHTDDPETLYRAKEAVIKELMDFDTPPRVYVQTNPEANTMVHENGFLMEIYGWTDPGTQILVNGSEIPVSAQGLFMIAKGVRKNNNAIKIEAKNAAGTKLITRFFDVEE